MSGCIAHDFTPGCVVSQNAASSQGCVAQNELHPIGGIRQAHMLRENMHQGLMNVSTMP
jgi:hypothetical protein